MNVNNVTLSIKNKEEGNNLIQLLECNKIALGDSMDERNVKSLTNPSVGSYVSQ